MNKEVTLNQVDGSIKGLAAIVSLNLTHPGGMGGPMYQVFEEDHCCADPISRCWSFWEVTEEDFPGHLASVIANPRAKYLRSVETIRALFGDEAATRHTPEAYLASK